MISKPMISPELFALGVLVTFAVVGLAALICEIARLVRRKAVRS